MSQCQLSNDIHRAGQEICTCTSDKWFDCAECGSGIVFPILSYLRQVYPPSWAVHRKCAASAENVSINAKHISKSAAAAIWICRSSAWVYPLKFIIELPNIVWNVLGQDFALDMAIVWFNLLVVHEYIWWVVSANFRVFSGLLDFSGQPLSECGETSRNMEKPLAAFGPEGQQMSTGFYHLLPSKGVLYFLVCAGQGKTVA